MRNQGKLITKGENNGRMFILDVSMPEVNSMLFTHGKGVGDIGIWHKRVGHVNLQGLKLMEKQNLVGGLPKFGIEEVMSKVCETCQLGKQVRFSCIAYVHVFNEKRSKLDPKAEKCIFIRYSLEEKVYRCFMTHSQVPG